MERKSRPALLAVLGLALLLSTALAANAQDRFQQCSGIEIAVDVNKGPGNWQNNAYVLKLQERGQGWTIYLPEDKRGQNIEATPGSKLRFNFNDGANHPINVTPSTDGGKALTIRSGSRPAIVLVDVGSSGSKRGAVQFTIDGADNNKAKINGCPGGNFYLDL